MVWKVTQAYRKLDMLYLVLRNAELNAEMSCCFDVGTPRATILADIKLELRRVTAPVDTSNLPVNVGETVDLA